MYINPIKEYLRLHWSQNTIHCMEVVIYFICGKMSGPNSCIHLRAKEKKRWPRVSVIEMPVWPTLGIIPSGHLRCILGPLSTHEPRAVTIKLWKPIRKCLKAVPRHLQNHVVWSRTFNCSVKSYVTRPSTKCYFKEILFMRVLAQDNIE